MLSTPLIVTHQCAVCLLVTAVRGLSASPVQSAQEEPRRHLPHSATGSGPGLRQKGRRDDLSTCLEHTITESAVVVRLWQQGYDPR